MPPKSKSPTDASHYYHSSRNLLNYWGETQEPPTSTAPFTPISEMKGLHTTLLLDLEVRVLVQPIGEKNQWAEKGIGRVNINGRAVIVMADQPPTEVAPHRRNDSDKAPTPKRSIDVFREELFVRLMTTGGSSDDFSWDQVIVLEVFSEDTPFVAENNCIVWNENSGRNSICLAFASSDAYIAVWSTLLAAQRKPIPNSLLKLDLLRLCKPFPESTVQSDGKGDTNTHEDEKMMLLVLPYSYYIHKDYNPPLGYVERHALSMSIIHHGHALNPALYSDPVTLRVLLDIATVELLDYIIKEPMYSHLAKCFGSTPPKEWTIPHQLSKLVITKELKDTMSNILRLHHLEREILVDKVDDEVSANIKQLFQQLQGKALRQIIENNNLVLRAKNALLAAPISKESLVSLIVSSKGVQNEQVENPEKNSVDYSEVDLKRLLSAEKQVFSYLHFFRSVVGLAVSDSTEKLVTPAVSALFDAGLLEALSIVAERYCLQKESRHLCWNEGGKGVCASTLFGLEEKKPTGEHYIRTRYLTSTNTSPNIYSPRIEKELISFLGTVLLHIDSDHEGAMRNLMFRIPIMSEPAKYKGLFKFLLQQITFGFRKEMNKGPLREPICFERTQLWFDLLGLNEKKKPPSIDGTVQKDDNVNSREVFLTYFIQKHLLPWIRGGMQPVPPAPNKSTVENKNSSSPVIAQQRKRISSFDALPPNISPSLIRLLDGIITRASTDDVESLLRGIFHGKSCVLKYMEVCCELAIQNSKQVCVDVLSSNVRLLTNILIRITPKESETERPVVNGLNGVNSNNNNNNNNNPSTEKPIWGAVNSYNAMRVSKSIITLVCRSLTAGRDMFGCIFRTYNALGGARKKGLFHSTVLGLLEYIGNFGSCLPPTETDRCFLRDLRDFIYIRHKERMPRMFSTLFRDAMIFEIDSRFAHDEVPSLSASLCTRGSYGSGIFTQRSGCIDELESSGSFFLGTTTSSTNPASNPSSPLGKVVDSPNDNMETFTQLVRTFAEEIVPPSILPLSVKRDVAPLLSPKTNLLPLQKQKESRENHIMDEERGNISNEYLNECVVRSRNNNLNNGNNKMMTNNSQKESTGSKSLPLSLSAVQEQMASRTKMTTK
ncbi:uncharacterized protein TM35_000044520 [Trypanosoma theileri]|uniref:Uncharacterized protein n=1 Tax=Trypanosoma theileri TaxID=67003 RepID=A0A1X0P5V9_9TRYP|nr:uncharacterized protein TM35_000044520 [Trypanosoma theileri]ORC92238.1 hypothetical protein TM35_000044520 [Trypanosoma theileri]